MRYLVISPDNIPIGGDFYLTIDEANKGFEKWAARYQKQGYYSSNDGRIALEDLRMRCEVESYTNENYFKRYLRDQIVEDIFGVLAEKFPEATDGGMEPYEMEAIDSAVERAALAWLNGNVPKDEG